MSKNQLSNRLDKLFDDIKEAEKQTLQYSESGKKAKKKTQKSSKKARSATNEALSMTVPVSVQESVVDARSTMSVPVRFDDDSWMTLAFYDDEEGRKWHEEEKLLAQQVVDQLSLALENARLFQETERRNEELRVLNEIISAASQSLELDETLSQVLEKTLAFLQMQGGLISMADPKSGTLHLSVWQDLPAPVINVLQQDKGLDNTLCGAVYAAKETLVIKNLRTDPSPVDVNLLLKNGLFSYVGIPFSARDKTIGTLCLFDNEPLEIADKNLALLSSVGRQVGFAVENARLFHEAQQRTEELGLLNKVVTEVSSAANLQKGLETIAEEIYRITNALHVGVALLDEKEENLILSTDYPDKEADLGLALPLKGNLLSQKVLSEKKPISIQDVLNNAETEAIREVMLQRGTQSLVIFPILSGKEAIGTVGVDFATPYHQLSNEEINLIQTILLQAGTAIETARLFQKTEEAASELRTLFAAMDDVIFVVDRETRYLRIAPTNPAGLYLDAEELLGKRMIDILPEELHELFLNAISEVTATEKTVNIEYPLEINGKETWFYASLSKLDENQIYWIARDITERKESERILQRQNDYMTAAAEVGRLVTSTLDMDILFRRAVNLLCEHFGYYHASIFINEEAGLNTVVRESTGEAGREMKERHHSLPVGSKSVVGTATGTGEPFIVNDVRNNPNHHVNPLLPDTRAEAAIPLKIGRRIIGALDLQATEVGAFTDEDVAVLQILADQFATAIDNARSYKIAQDAFTEMRELDKLKSQFLANMSHELRTPLNSIIGFSRVILKGIDGPITDLQQQDLTAIYNSGQHLLGLINDILDLSKIEAGKMELTFDEVDIEKLIKSVMSTVIGLIKDKPVRLVENIEENMPVVRADAMRVRQILINLFSNASKFTDEGTITVNAAREGNFIRIGVTDSGPGISPEDQEKLFKAFSQVDASATRATGGTGLGLSICRELVNMHGGKIDVESEVGKGSTFFFTLPLFYPEDETEADETESGETESDAPVILCIDDDEQVIQLYKRYLSTQGYQVVALTEPKKALERVKEIKPHAVTLDIMMPGYDGWQVLETLKSDKETQKTPVIICSIVEDTEKGYALGATDYLLKPILEDDLLTALERIDMGGMIRDVLVIDDDEDDLRLLEKFLSQSAKYEPTLAKGGLEGWEKLQSMPPHVVILDLFMPEMDGFQIIERMQEEDALRQVPVIVVSGSDLTSKQQEKLSALNHHLIQKGSLDSEGLIAVLERTLQQITPNISKGSD